jgi:hypothetical protein
VHFPRVEGALLKSGLMKGLWVNKFGIKGFITFTLKYGLVETQKWKIKALENWCGLNLHHPMSCNKTFQWVDLQVAKRNFNGLMEYLNLCDYHNVKYH